MVSDSPTKPFIPSSPFEPPPVTVPENTAHASWLLFCKALDQARVALDAQFSVWKYSLAQVVILIALSVPMAVAGLLLIIHGFLLLDSVLDIELAQLYPAPWFSPLVRGAVYFGIPAVGALIVVVGALPKTKKKRDAHVKP